MADQTRTPTDTALPPPNEYGSIILDEDGMYLHLDDLDHVRISTGDNDGVVYVSAREFMQVQRERDELRRALAFINAWRTKERWWEPRPLTEFLDRTLDRVGLTLADGRAMAGLIRSVDSRHDAHSEEPTHG